MNKSKENSNRKVNVVVIGSINCDLTSYLSVFPEMNQTVMARHSVQSMGGKGLNQAVAAARAGANVSFVGCVGDDEFGNRALSYMKTNGVDSSFVSKVENTSTGMATILVTDDGNNLIAVAPGANYCLSSKDILTAYELIKSADVLIVQLEVPAETVRTALECARETDTLSILNPAPAADYAKELYPLADIVTPNETETFELTGVKPSGPEGVLEAAKVLVEKGVKQVAITLGADGCFVYTKSACEHIPPFQVEVVDPTGAGDVFNGVLAVAMGEGLILKEAAVRASAAASLSVTKAMAEGAAPSREEINRFIESSAIEDLVLAQQ